MKPHFLFIFAAFFFVSAVFAQGIPESPETFPLWADLAPGEKTAGETRNNAGAGGQLRIIDVTVPVVKVFRPEKKETDACVLIFPGGGYNNLNQKFASFIPFFNSRGMTCAILEYRVPRRPAQPIWLAPLQDAQRAIRLLRSKAGELGINPEKIGSIGFSAGGHLSVIAATNSQTNYYTPADALDQVPCHLNFAIAVYPAYVLEDGAEGENARRGIDEKILPAFKFDAKTPPMCLVHGDADVYSPLGSVAIYTELHRRNIPVELHIYTKSGHGLGNQKWEERIWDWLKSNF